MPTHEVEHQLEGLAGVRDVVDEQRARTATWLMSTMGGSTTGSSSRASTPVENSTLSVPTAFAPSAYAMPPAIGRPPRAIPRTRSGE